jgi:ribulose-bisphosphate carboxylase large chain
MTTAGNSLGLSGDRFSVTYHLTGEDADVRKNTEDICVEQSVEFPAELIDSDEIRQHILGHVESFNRIQENRYKVVISYAIELSAFEITQLLNVVFGNISLKPGIQVIHLELPDNLLKSFRGPRFGMVGWRKKLKIFKRPLLCSALKPMGLSNHALAEMAYKYALGGIDLIKDDHGLTNQPFSPFKERVGMCVESIDRANRESGNHCEYLPNITSPANELAQRALFARKAGAGGLLIAPGLIGFDAMRILADDDLLNLPIMSHPAFLGSYVTSNGNGISHGTIFGQITRLAGADASIYPNWGGRFAFSKDDCASIVEGATSPMGSIKTIFPAPGGGMTMARVPEMLEVYGKDVIFLMGGGLHSRGQDLVENCRYFRQLVEKI